MRAIALKELQDKLERSLIALAVSMGARSVPGWSAAEERLAHCLPKVGPVDVERARFEIRQGLDPLGDRFTALRSAVERRPMGATYTPLGIVDYMVAWAQENGGPREVSLRQYRRCRGPAWGNLAWRAGSLTLIRRGSTSSPADF